MTAELNGQYMNCPTAKADSFRLIDAASQPLPEPHKLRPLRLTCVE